jgi:hypothetical protein
LGTRVSSGTCKYSKSQKPAPEPRSWHCGIAGIETYKPELPEKDKLATLDKLSDGDYVLTHFGVYFSETGRDRHLGEARLIYQLKTPESINPSEDFYHGFSSENDQKNFMTDFFLAMQIDPTPRVVGGRLIYNPATPL